MPIRGRYFPSQVIGERIFLLVRRHWFIFAAMGLLFLVLVLPIFILIFYWTANPEVFSGILGNFVVVFGGMYSLTVLGLALYGFVNYYLDVYIVTNKRIVDIKQNGFFNREIAELHLHQVQDVEAKVEGFLQTLFHYGTIYIQTAGERENFVFEDVPHPYRLAKEIVELHEAQIESEYEPKIKKTDVGADDYRPEDYINLEEEKKISMIKKDEERIEELKKEMQLMDETPALKEDQKLAAPADDPSKPVAEFGFGAEEPKTEKGFESELKELEEGEEIKVNDRSDQI